MSEDGDAARAPTDPDEAMDDDLIDTGDRADSGISAAVGPATLGGWLAYVGAPVLVGTVAYWFVSDATAIEAVVFAAMMVGAVLAMDYLFDTIPE